MTIERRLSPEEEELLAKQAELENLADQLARKELDLQTIRGEIDAFFRAYNFPIESQLVEANEMRARVAQCIYVLNPVDRLNHRIQVFDLQGRFLRKWGVNGKGNGRFPYPWGLAIDGDGNVFVSDNENHRIQVFKRVLVDD